MLASDTIEAQSLAEKDNNESDNLIKIRKINVFESPILTVQKDGKNLHIVLDTGATASLISLDKAKELGLKILPTAHKALQVDGISDLKVLGEVHTQFNRGAICLTFSGLVVNKLGTDILGGTNFHRENDIYCRIAKDTIVINGSKMFQATPVEVMQLDNRYRSPKLVKVKQSKIIVSGDTLQLELPPTCEENETYFVEPKYGQGEDICEPQIVKADNNILNVETKNRLNETIKLKKNMNPIQIRKAEYCTLKNEKNFKDVKSIPSIEKTSIEEKIDMMKLDPADLMSPNQKQKFVDTIKEYSDVLDESLPGYNNYYGKVYASIKFSTKARPLPHKTRMPKYGEHGQKLYDQKVQAMIQKGVLIDPYELGIQPAVINDSWIIKKTVISS